MTASFPTPTPHGMRNSRDRRRFSALRVEQEPNAPDAPHVFNYHAYIETLLYIKYCLYSFNIL